MPNCIDSIEDLRQILSEYFRAEPQALENLTEWTEENGHDVDDLCLQ